jgi:hypothetical protein
MKKINLREYFKGYKKIRIKRNKSIYLSNDSAFLVFKSELKDNIFGDSKSDYLVKKVKNEIRIENFLLSYENIANSFHEIMNNKGYESYALMVFLKSDKHLNIKTSQISIITKKNAKILNEFVNGSKHINKENFMRIKKEIKNELSK